MEQQLVMKEEELVCLALVVLGEMPCLVQEVASFPMEGESGVEEAQSCKGWKDLEYVLKIAYVQLPYEDAEEGDDVEGVECTQQHQVEKTDGDLLDMQTEEVGVEAPILFLPRH